MAYKYQIMYASQLIIIENIGEITVLVLGLSKQEKVSEWDLVRYIIFIFCPLSAMFLVEQNLIQFLVC